ncbi:MAG TPA: ATP-binding protein [Clostridia bacterium]|nr:ATP-binding protein [Clostridia bacterium]
MSIQTNLSGRLRNTSLPVTAGLLPLFEAVVNSIHSIEEAVPSPEEGRITVEILRKPKQGGLELESLEKKAGPHPKEDIIGFKITDNGVGFTEMNMRSFETLDSDYKASKGGRGIGRLLWLKAFASAHVISIYRATTGELRVRQFDFLSHKGVVSKSDEAVSGTQQPETTIHLDGFMASYRDNSRKTANAISESILEHCLWYFVRAGGAPHISLQDDGEVIHLDNLYESQMHSSASSESLEIKGTRFDLTHVKLRSNLLGAHALAFCAQNRVVTAEKLNGKVNGLHGRLSDSKGEFVYECYVNSSLLDETARPERIGFDILEESDPLFAGANLSLKEIRAAVIESATKHLAPYLSDILLRSRQRVETFVAKKAPRYRPILARIPPNNLNVDPEISDKELDLALHKFLADLERQLLTEGHEIMMAGTDENYPEYKKRLAEYLSKAEDIKLSDLANYVSHRRVILDLLQMAIGRQPGGDYAREDLIHNLIMPMGTTSDDLMPDTGNLWLVDERLAFHDYLASDKTIASMPITECEDTKEPDLCALNVFDNPILVSEGSRLPLASIVVVEIKRPMRNDAKPGEVDDPVEQAVGYLNRIRKGEVLTPQGRPIPESESIPGFCYVLADLTPKLKERCLIHHDLRYTPDKMGFFGYKANCNAYIEVISFERLVNAAKERNRAFFDKLGLPTT